MKIEIPLPVTLLVECNDDAYDEETTRQIFRKAKKQAIKLSREIINGKGGRFLSGEGHQNLKINYYIECNIITEEEWDDEQND